MSSGVRSLKYEERNSTSLNKQGFVYIIEETTEHMTEIKGRVCGYPQKLKINILIEEPELQLKFPT